MQHQKLPLPISIFCAAAQPDAELLAQWERHLIPLQQANQITVWSEQHLMAGTPRIQQLHKYLDQAQVIIFLLSPDFFASDECMALVERALSRPTRIIPLLVRPVGWETSTLADLACIPFNGQFVTAWGNQDHAFHTCILNLQQILGLSADLPQTHRQLRPSTLQNQNRVHMLRRLRRSYNELMNQSLQGVVWLELGLTEKPDAVQNAINLLFRISNLTEQHLPPGTSITQAYDDAEHELLILGEPGAGKSTLLLDLAQQLILRAEQDETHPLPVILPLSSWAIKRQSLQDWIAEQLTQIYDVPRKLSVRWVEEDSILPLLDGLDEMEQKARPACVAAINTYHRNHLSAIVVCSRTTEYKTATKHRRLALQKAVMVQPLTNAYVDAHLAQAGKALVALRSALKKNVSLHNLATKPLMLNILILTYHGTSVRDLPKKTTPLLQQVWNDYIQRMVASKGNSKRYPLEQTCSWLGWLARQMRDHNQTVFYLENLQPDWLSIKQQRTYTWSATRLPNIVIGVLTSILSLFFLGEDDPFFLLRIGILGGLFGGLWHEPVLKKASQGKHRHPWGKHLIKRLAPSACIGLVYGLSLGLRLGSDYTVNKWQIEGISNGMMLGLGIFLLQYLSTALIHPNMFSRNNITESWKRAVHFGFAVLGPRVLLVGAVTGLIFGLSFELSYMGISGPNYSIISGLIVGLIIGLSSGLLFGLNYALISLILGTQTEGIRLTERTRWTWKDLRSGLFNSGHLLLSILLTCTLMISSGLSFIDEIGPSLGMNVAVKAGLSLGLSAGLSYWFLVGLIQGIDQERIEDQDRRIVNQGIHRSLRNSVVMGLIGSVTTGITSILNQALGIWLAVELSYGLTSPLSDALKDINDSLSIGVPACISGAVLICLLSGGLAVWRHYVIRFLLQHSRIFPWRSPQFLDDATARFLLRRDGGGYSFSHRLLLDHFADAKTGTMPDANE